MADIAELGVRIKTEGAREANAELSQLEKEAKKAAEATDKLGDQSKKTGNEIGQMGDEAGQATGKTESLWVSIAKGVQVQRLVEGAVRAVIESIKASFAEYAQYELVTAKLAQSLEHVGNVSGMSVKSLQEFAASLEQTSGVAEEEIIKIETVINRMGRVSGARFKEVTQLALDMAAALGTDPVQAAETLARALNDPERGITMLRRSFESMDPAIAQQITQMARMGNSAEALDKIIEMLKDKVGGASGAQSNTLTGAWNRATDAAGDLGRVLIEITGAGKRAEDFFNTFGEVVSDATDYMRRSKDEATLLGYAIDGVAASAAAARGDIEGFNKAIDHMHAREAAAEINRSRKEFADFGEMVKGAAIRVQEWGKAQLDGLAATGRLSQEYAKETALVKQGNDVLAKAAAGEAEVAKQRAKFSQEGATMNAVSIKLAREHGEAMYAEAKANDARTRSSHAGASADASSAKEKERAFAAIDAYVRRLKEEAAVIGQSKIARDQETASLRIEEAAIRAGIPLMDRRIQQKKDEARAAVSAKDRSEFIRSIEEETARMRDEAKAADLSGAAHDNLISKLELERKARDVLGDATDEQVQGYIREQAAIRSVIEVKKKDEEMTRQAVDDITGFFTSIIDGSDDAIGALGKLLIKMVEVYLQAQLLNSMGGDGGGGGILGSIISLGAGLFGGGSGGGFTTGLYASGGVRAFGSGGGREITRPEMRGNDMAGEQNHEAVFPLVRSSNGDLGVRASGGDSSPRVVVQNIDQRKSGAPLETSTSRGQNGEMQIRTFIRDEVKRAVADGSMDKDMSKNYNLNRNPTRRS